MQYFGLAITWLVIVGLLIASFWTEEIPIWLPLVLYVVATGVRIYEKVGNYKDWIKINEHDEKRKLLDVANDMANRGLTFSGIRQDKEKKVKEDFAFERKKAYRKLVVETINSLFLG